MKKNYWYLFGLMTAILSSCVSAKKYQTLNNRYDYVSRTRIADTTRLFLESTRHIQERDSLEIKYNQQVNAYLQLKNDSTSLAQNYNRNKKLLDDLFEKYDQLDKSYKQLSTSLSSDEVNHTQNVSQKEKELLILEQKLLAQQANNDKLAAVLQEREVKMLAFENSIRKMEKSTGDLKKKLEKSLLSHKDSAIRIEQRPGNIAILFPESVAFGSGNLSAQYTELLKKIASILKIQPDFRIVATSMLPIPSKESIQNEELSRGRIFYIADVLKKEGVTFDRITVSIKYPSISNEVGKKQDRMTQSTMIEIIVQPKHDSILQIIQNN